MLSFKEFKESMNEAEAVFGFRSGNFFGQTTHPFKEGNLAVKTADGSSAIFHNKTKVADVKGTKENVSLQNVHSDYLPHHEDLMDAASNHLTAIHAYRTK